MTGTDPTGGGLPRIEISELHRSVQAAAFALLLEHDTAVTVDEIADRTGLTAADVTEHLADFDTVGRIRRNEHGDIVGIAGLSIDPTRHRLDIGPTARWTWCALDAIGILGALQRHATFTTNEPDTDQQLTVAFTPDGPTDTDTVVFIADGYGSDSVVDTWCPTVNLFPNHDTATAWADRHGATGQPIPVTQLAPDATAMWAHIVDG